jgi:hypothetical protein
MKIEFDKLTDIVIVKEQKNSVMSINLTSFTDNLTEKKVIAYIYEIGNIILWEGAAYDAAGQYTEQDIYNRVKELLQ